MCHVLLVLPFAGLVLFWLLPLEQAALLYSLLLVGCSVLFWLMWEDFWRSATTGIEGMTRAKAEVIEDGRGNLKVFVRGEIWDAVCREDLSVGQKVRVTSLDRMTLLVEPYTGGNKIPSEK